MFEVKLKSTSLKKYLQTILGKQPNEPITDTDLKSVSTLKLDSAVLDDVSIEDLVFFDHLQFLSLSGINIGNKEVSILNRLKNVKTLSISNAKISLNQLQYLNENLQSLIFDNCEGIDLSNFNSSKALSNLTIVNCKNINLYNISDLESLEEVILPNNKTLTDRHIENVWNLPNLKRVNLDGSDNISISDAEHEGIIISHNSEYHPTESKDWNIYKNAPKLLHLNSLLNYTPEQLSTLSGANIQISASDTEFLKSEKGQNIIKALQKNNKFDLSLKTTADMSMEDMESLNTLCNFDSVHIYTGWPVTQNMGYSYQTYKAIKQEIVNMVKDIDPNLSDYEKYKAIREKVTKNIKYDYSALQANKDDKDYYASRSLENVLLNHTCVCAGYANAFKNLAAEVGLEAKYVEGKTNTGELHAWNQIRLQGDDGQYYWYNDDVTFDAVGDDKSKFSLIDDDEFSKTHICIPERTEGGSVYSCNVPASAVLRAEKNDKNYQASHDDDDDAR